MFVGLCGRSDSRADDRCPRRLDYTRKHYDSRRGVGLAVAIDWHVVVLHSSAKHPTFEAKPVAAGIIGTTIIVQYERVAHLSCDVVYKKSVQDKNDARNVICNYAGRVSFRHDCLPTKSDRGYWLVNLQTLTLRIASRRW